MGSPNFVSPMEPNTRASRKMGKGMAGASRFSRTGLATRGNGRMMSPMVGEYLFNPMEADTKENSKTSYAMAMAVTFRATKKSPMRDNLNSMCKMDSGPRLKLASISTQAISKIQ